VSYNLVYRASFRREFADLSALVRERLVPHIEALAVDPRPPGARPSKDIFEACADSRR